MIFLVLVCRLVPVLAPVDLSHAFLDFGVRAGSFLRGLSGLVGVELVSAGDGGLSIQSLLMASPGTSRAVWLSSVTT